MQCIYCQQIRAKNTSRQKQHLLECPGLRGHPNAPQPQSAAPGPNGIGPANGYPATPNGPAATAPGPGPGPAAGTLPNTNGPMMSNGVNPHTAAMQTPLQNLSNRPPLPTPGATAAPAGSSAVPQPQQRPVHTPKSSSKPRTSTSNLPAPPLDDVHAAFVEFRAKEEDKVRMALLRRSLMVYINEWYILMNESSVCLSNASTVSKFAQRTQADSANICSNARPTSMS